MPGFVPIPRRMNFGRPVMSRIGPWPDGQINRFSDLMIGQKAAQYVKNLDVLPTGELRQRGPMMQSELAKCWGTDAIIQALLNSGYYAVNSAGNQLYDWEIDYCKPWPSIDSPVVLISYDFASGYQVASTITKYDAGGTAYFVGMNAKQQNVTRVFELGGNLQCYNSAGHLLQYSGASTTSGGAVWTDAGAAAGLPSFNSARHVYVYKSRIYMWGGDPNQINPSNTVYFSQAGNANVFNGSDGGFFKVGDTAVEYVTAVIGVRNTLYIFTPTTTWALALPNSGPPTNGTLQKISNTIGAGNPRAVVEDNGRIFVAGPKGIYELYNGVYTDIGYSLGADVIGILSSGSWKFVGYSLSIIRDRVILSIKKSLTTFMWPTNQFTDGTTQALPGAEGQSDPPTAPFYVFNVKSRAWSCYDLPDTYTAPSNGGLGAPYNNNLAGTIVPLSPSQIFPVTSGEVGTRAADTNVYYGKDTYGVFLDAPSGKVYLYQPEARRSDLPKSPTYFSFVVPGNPSISSDNPWADYYAGAYQVIDSQLWTQEIEGGTVETASIKRYYAVVVNVFKPANTYNLQIPGVSRNVPGITLTLTDHNGDVVADPAIGVVINSPASSQYISAKAYTSIRARHLQYRIALDCGRQGPLSIISLDVLAKVKQPEQSGQVGG